MKPFPPFAYPKKNKSSLTPRKQEGKMCGLEYAKKISTESR
jgi:hypothetical protein